MIVWYSKFNDNKMGSNDDDNNKENTAIFFLAAFLRDGNHHQFDFIGTSLQLTPLRW